MKLNGALKPRHGASTEGSSPGAGQLRKYRDKRYPNDTCRHVLNGCLSQQQRQQQFSECGVNNNNSNSQDSNNSQPHSKEHQEQQEQQQPQSQRRHSKKCDETSLRSNEEGQILTNINNTNTKQNRINTVDGSSHGSGAAKAPTGGSGNHDDKDNDAVITLKQKQQLCITTRQANNKSSDKPNISEHNKQHEEHTEHITNSGVGENLPIANYHVTPPDERNTNSSSSRSRGKSNNTTTTIRRPHCWKEVNKLSLVWKVYEPLFWRALPFSTVIISRLFKQFKSFLLWFAFFMFSAGSTIGGKCGGGEEDGGPSRRAGRVARYSSLVNIMRASQSFVASLDRICFKNAYKSRLPLTTTTNSIALCLLVYGAAAAMLLPQPVFADDGDNFFSPNGIAIGEATTEFDYASRGQKKFGDKCDNTLECGFPGSICDTKKKSCQCTEDLPITNHIDKCGKDAAVNESCFFNEQCESKYFQTECRDGRCVCRFDMTPTWLKDGSVECKGRQDKRGPETYIDPAMIGVLIGMALMFIIICVVLRLFSQARWRENRTIFNTPNPRLMNVSLLRESKLLHGQERRGSRMSVRAPSRQPSMASLRPHSPNPSLGRMTRSKSNTRSSDSRVSDASNCSRLLEHSHTANTHHHAPHPHANASIMTTASNATTHANGIHSASVSPHSTNAPMPTPTTTTTYVSQVTGSRSNSHGSNASATSLRSTRSNSVSPAINNAHHERKGSTYHPHQHHQQHPPPPLPLVQQQQHLQQPNIIANPVAESVTVDIIEPEK